MNVNKTIQALAYLMRLGNIERISYMKALKLLYIVDRENLRRTGATLTGDTPFAMKYGPVLGKIYDLIKLDPEFEPKDLHEQSWCATFRREGYDLRLLDAAAEDELSACDRELLVYVYDTFGTMTQFQLSDATHAFPEWQEAFWGDGACPIALSAMAKAVGLPPEDQAIAFEMDAARLALEAALSEVSG